MFDAEITIIGAGVVGLAIAEKISQHNPQVFVVEKHSTFGQETSSRNSEVIHAGIYYVKNSLKAKLCVEGKNLLYHFCDRYELPYHRCGKLIVATTEEEITALEQVEQKALSNGVADLYWMTQEEVKAMEPNLFAVKALFSPSTGVIDSYWYLKRLETNSINNGVQFAYSSVVTGIEKLTEGYQIDLNDADGQPFSFTSKKVINAAGLESFNIASMVGVNDEDLTIHFCKGEYFRIQPPKHKLLNRLVYPVPSKDALGIHVTIDMGGGVKLGPDVQYLDTNEYDYTLTPSRRKVFFESTHRFLPFLEEEDLIPEMAGIRPKTQTKDGPPRDFYIREESMRGLPGFVNLIGMESPGLTASLAIGNYVERLLNGQNDREIIKGQKN